LTAIKDDYDGYIAHIKSVPNNDVRKDVMTIIKWTMCKRTIIKLATTLIGALITIGLLPSFLG